MCSIIVVRAAWADTPLLICANRDEQLSRPSEGLRLRRIGERQVVSPRDLQAGGTWLGTNDYGLFVGITNRFSGPPDASRRSRGALVHHALEADTVAEAIRTVEALPADTFNPCHLLLASLTDLAVLVNTGSEWSKPTLECDVVIVSERTFDAAPTTRDSLLDEGVQQWLRQSSGPDNQDIQRLMSTHATPTFEGACVHWLERGYGTRTLTVIRSDENGSLYHYSTDGPPCTSPLIRFGKTV